MGNVTATTEKKDDAVKPYTASKLGTHQLESYRDLWDQIKTPGKETANAASVSKFLKKLWEGKLDDLAKSITKSLVAHFGSDGVATRKEFLELLVPFCTRDCGRQTDILFLVFLDGRNSASKSEVYSIFEALASIVGYLYDKSGKVAKAANEPKQIRRFVCKPLVKALFGEGDSMKLLPKIDFAQWMNSNIRGLYSSSFGNLIYTTFFPCKDQDMSKISHEHDEGAYSHHNVWKLPVITPSPILPRHTAWLLGAMMPQKNSNVRWEKLYATSRDGTSLINLAYEVIGYESSTFLILSDGKALFGAYMETAWKDMAKPYGTNKFFLYRLYPELKVYRMKSGSASKFMYSNTKKIVRSALPTGIGFGVDDTLENFRLWLKDDLQSGTAEQFGNTYQDGRLAHTKEFKILSLEVWGCGGAAAVQARAEARKKEIRETERRRKIDRAAVAENWADSPDKWMLDLAGITGGPKTHPDDHTETT